MNMLDGVKIIYILYWIAVFLIVWLFEKKVKKLEDENAKLKKMIGMKDVEEEA